MPSPDSTSPGQSADTSSDVLVRFSNVQKSYDGEILVVKDLNLDVERGEFLTMLGPSGSGKTTCLMMLAGFEPATNGEIFLDGEPINNVPPHKRGIGMVFQNYALFPHMSVAENLAFPLDVRGMSSSERSDRVKKALAMVQLEDFGNRRPAQLSGGQQQRVAVARALVFDPDLVLMDEPLGALDKNLREQMQYEIKHIHVQQLAPPADLYERPENAFVAQFIGENNRLEGVVEEMAGRECLVRVSDGSIVKALAVNVKAAGDSCTLSLRPERVVANPASGEVQNQFNARVEELIYLGDHIRARMLVCGNNEFIVKVPNSADKSVLREGLEAPVGWLAEDCRALAT